MQKSGIIFIGIMLNHVDPGSMYHRVFAIVPLVGAGTPTDPKRPMFAPLPSEIKSDHSGILAFQMQFSDDRKMALVEIVAANRAALSNILTATAPGLAVFEVGVAAKSDIETAFQTYKKGFTLNNWIPARPQ
ncbi:MAG: hypothetical protein ABSB35_37880 [Bryobacteraceae bacterium]